MIRFVIHTVIFCIPEICSLIKTIVIEVKSIYPFSKLLYPLQGCRDAGAYPSISGHRWVIPWTDGLSITGFTDTHTFALSFTPVFWIVGETGVPGGNPLRHRENMQTPHRRASWLSWDSGIYLLWGNSACPSSHHATLEGKYKEILYIIEI